MSVRRTINKYKTAPGGYDFDNVLKRGKAFYKNQDFEMQPHDFGNGVYWGAETVTMAPFKASDGTILVKRIERGWKLIK